MSRQELMQRTKGLDQWLRHNLHSPNYNGVKQYHQRLLALMYQSKPSIN